MSELHFVSEHATPHIIARVTSVCSLCYTDILEGDEIFYDTQHYRYLCRDCYEKLQAEYASSIDEEIDNDIRCGSLFG